MGTATPGAAPEVDWGEPRGERYTIAEVVARTDVPSSTIHHYRRAGLIPEPERISTNRFAYDDRHLTALGLVRALRREGRALDEIRRALPALWCADAGLLDGAIDAYVQAGPGDTTRSRLVDAAIDAFAVEGYQAVSIEGLCARAGVAKGTFYRHFAGKDELFLTAATEVVERAIAAFTHDIEAGAGDEHAALFARHLRHGLPVLLELAKRSVQDSGEMVQAAAKLFAGLAGRLGQATGNTEDPAQAGGFVIVLAVVEIFAELVEHEL